MENRFENEVAAYDAVARLLAEARRVAQLCRDAGIECPRPVSRMLDDSNGALASSDTQVDQSTKLRKETRSPNELGEGWISIQIKYMSTTGLVLGILRRSEKPLRFKEIMACMKQYRPRVATGSVFNVSARLEGDVIHKVKGLWALRDINKAPKLEGSFAVGPKGVFSMYELAAHRREIICNILDEKPAGLTTMQLVGELELSDKCVAPVGKDIVMADLRNMAKEGRIRRFKKMWRRQK